MSKPGYEGEREGEGEGGRVGGVQDMGNKNPILGYGKQDHHLRIWGTMGTSAGTKNRLSDIAHG
eukprot:5148355-Pyramimonas_sp.AAC.1